MEDHDENAPARQHRSPRFPPSASAAWACRDLYGPADETESIATIHAALEAGITLLDTGDFYGMGHNELLIARRAQGPRPRQRHHQRQVRRAARPRRRLARLSTRGPAAVKNFLAYTLQRLGTDHVDIYRPARLDPDGADRGHRRRDRRHGEGRLRAPHRPVRGRRGDASAAPHAVHPIADLQIEYSLISRGIEAEILPACRELGIGVTAYGVLSRGLLSGHWSTRAQRRPERLPQPPAPLQRRQPRPQPGAGRGAARASREAKGVTVAQLAIAWVLAQGDDIVPLVGARTPRPADGGARRARRRPSTATTSPRIEQAVPAGRGAGRPLRPRIRCATLDSERGNAAAADD